MIAVVFGLPELLIIAAWIAGVIALSSNSNCSRRGACTLRHPRSG